MKKFLRSNVYTVNNMNIIFGRIMFIFVTFFFHCVTGTLDN